LPVYGDGMQVAGGCGLHVEDHCVAIALALKGEKPGGEVYNVGREGKQ